MLSASISEPWELDGTLVKRPKADRAAHLSPFIVDCSGTGDAPAVQAARAAICAAAPAAVRLVLEALPLLVDLQRAAEGSSADAEVLGLHVNLSRARLAELVKLNAQVTAALEGRS